MNVLYVEEGRLITSAGTGAEINCCLYTVREYHGPQTANNVARAMVMPPYREGGQAQFIEQPVAASTQDAQINRLHDYLRKRIAKSHSIDDLVNRTSISRRIFMRRFIQ